MRRSYPLPGYDVCMACHGPLWPANPVAARGEGERYCGNEQCPKYVPKPPAPTAAPDTTSITT